MSRRSVARWGCGCVLTAVVAGWLVQGARADSETDAARRQEAVKAETDQVVRRVGTMLGVLEYYRFDKAEEKKVLEEVAGTLNGLSREQMTEVIARLDSAA